MSGKVAFVTPRYGTEVMGGAETAARKLAEHLQRPDELGGRGPYHVRPRPPHLGRRAPAGDDRDQRRGRAPPSVGARPPPDFYGLDGLLRLAPRLATWAQGRRWVDYNGPVSPELVEAVVASDADVVAFYPYLYHPTVAHHRQGDGAGGAPSGGARRAGAVPAGVPRHVRGRGRLLLPHRVRTRARGADVPGGGAAADRARARCGRVARPGRPGAELLGLGDRPYVVSVGRVDEHKGSKMLASYFATYKERHPGPLALALVGPVSFELPPHPDIVVTGAVDEPDKWDIVRDALVAISPSALESFSLVVVEAWVDRVPVLVNGACGPTTGARRALRRRAVVHVLPRVRGGARPARLRRPAARRARRRRAGLRRPALPVAGAHSALRRVPHVGGGAGEGHARAVLRRARAAADQETGRPTTVYIGWSMASLPMSWARWWRWAGRSSRSVRSPAAPAWRPRRPDRSTTSWSGGARPRGRSA